MADEEISSDSLRKEIVTLRNQINNLKFELSKRDLKTAEKAKEDESLKGIREYAAWVVFATPAVLCVLAPDGTTRFINPFCETFTGYRADEMLGKNWWRLFFQGDDFAQIGKLLRALDKGDVRDYELTITTKGAQKRTLAHHSINRYDETGKLKEIILVGIDVSARKRVESQLERSEEKFRTLISNIPCAVYRCIPNEEKWTMIHMSDYVEKIAGYSSWDFIENRTMPYFEIIHPEDRDHVKRSIKTGMENRQPFIVEYRIKHKDGTIRWVYEKGQGYFGRENKLQWLDGVLFDITDRKEMERKLAETLEKVKNLSLTDELTQLYNRRGFITHAEQQIRVSDRKKRPISILFADLDGMKEINDQLGHKMGDQALIETAAILNNTFRKADVIARLGGDEFAVLAVETNEETAVVMSDRLQKNIREFNEQTGLPFKLAISTGISTYDPENPCSLEKLLERADDEMYKMKRINKGLDRDSPAA
ncbi:MAG TPA: diguanylate cyclase [Verrucomicrobiae bacterium]|jgi:diguanylate cyclase (GGDEF)-like protein/PAS domain S-box-containing protein|nr:diguanylate cyclase [Verrucomicrobiae bacterium]